MLYQWLLVLKKPSNKLWVSAASWALLTVIFVLSLRLGARTLEVASLPDIKQETLESLLNVIASSMLAVTTFSLSIMVAAFASASNGATPRATDLVMGDSTTRTAITSFICAFIYAIIAKTALGMAFYAQNGRFILFISTVAVLLYLIITLIRWVYTLSQLGRLGNTLEKIEQVTGNALQQYRHCPQMNAVSTRQLSSVAKKIEARKSGYLTHIDMQGLQKKAQALDGYIHIYVRPGELISPDTVICALETEQDVEEETLHQYFVLAKGRTYEQDPNWGFIVLSEAAQRALSSAVNDPGTAINIMTIMMNLFVQEPESQSEAHAVEYDRLSIVELDCAEWIRDAFAPISRDGAGILEVNLVMQKVLACIWRNVPEKSVSQAALLMAEQALTRAEHTLTLKADIEQLREKHVQLFHSNR
ncbi:DUF2254 domain-containing protein [Pasteurella multocida]|uniref:DUF2254 domain-containing protein n=1 Tax=Pasteurella multocida TaxID=747 RepID=UPI000BBD0939|nr:DUF2254 family protein [Pasteurella multocida]ATF75451.1 hypothetical protein CO688_08615 [Pasteurella multocida]ATN17852.1 DUF2254 domain-containing protein [Pasteurella multocida]AWB52304.1 DUF2254 domain-containing protein [Pasteurella multocida]MEB3465432.1 DUF2254 family protein [Pasteurella multocida]MEB3472447.1 DUF2254 family protein [Pasteurella multocida]